MSFAVMFYTLLFMLSLNNNIVCIETVMHIARQTWFCLYDTGHTAVTLLVVNTQGWDITENYSKYVTLISI